MIDPFDVKSAIQGARNIIAKRGGVQQKDPKKLAAITDQINEMRARASNTGGGSSGGGNRGGGTGAAPVSTLAGLPQTPELAALIAKGIIKEGMAPEQALAILSIQGLIGQVPIDIDALQAQIKANYAQTGNVTADASAWMQQMMGANAPTDPAMAALYAQDPMFAGYAGTLGTIDETAQQNQATDLSWFDKQQQAMIDYYTGLQAGMSAGTIATGGGGGGGGGGRGGGGYGGGGGGSGDTNVKLVEQQQIRDAAQQTNQELYPGWEDALRALEPDNPAYQQLFHQMHAESGGVPWKFERLANQQLQENVAQEAADDLVNLDNNAWLSGLAGNTQNALDEYMSLNGLIQDYDPTTGATQLIRDPNESDEARTLRMERQSLMTEEEKAANEQRAALTTAANNPALMPPEVLKRLALKQQVFTPPTGGGPLADLIAEHQRFVPGTPAANTGGGTGNAAGNGLVANSPDYPFAVNMSSLNTGAGAGTTNKPGTSSLGYPFPNVNYIGSSTPTANGVPTYPNVAPGEHPTSLDTVPTGGPAVYPTDLSGRTNKPNMQQLLAILGQQGNDPNTDPATYEEFLAQGGDDTAPTYHSATDDLQRMAEGPQPLPGVNFQGGGAGQLVQRPALDYQSVTDALLGRKPVPEEGLPVDTGQEESTPQSRAEAGRATIGANIADIFREGLAKRETQISPLARRLDFGGFGAGASGQADRSVLANLRANAIARFYNASDEEREAIANSPDATWGTNLVEANSLAQDEEGNWRNTGPLVRPDMVSTLKMQSEEALGDARAAHPNLDEETFNRYLPRGKYWNSNVMSPEDRQEIDEENSWINRMWNTSYNLNPNTGMNPTRNQLQSTGTDTSTATQTLYPEDEVALPITGGITDPDSGVTWDALFNKGATNPVRLGDETGGETLSLSDPDYTDPFGGGEAFKGYYSTDFVRNLLDQSADLQAQKQVAAMAKGRLNPSNKTKASYTTKPSTPASKAKMSAFKTKLAALPKKTDGGKKRTSGGKRQQAV